MRSTNASCKSEGSWRSAESCLNFFPSPGSLFAGHGHDHPSSLINASTASTENTTDIRLVWSVPTAFDGDWNPRIAPPIDRAAPIGFPVAAQTAPVILKANPMRRFHTFRDSCLRWLPVSRISSVRAASSRFALTFGQKAHFANEPANVCCIFAMLCEMRFTKCQHFVQRDVREIDAYGLKIQGDDLASRRGSFKTQELAKRPY